MRLSDGSVDVSEVPKHGFETKSPAWWGTIGFMAVEGTSLILCAAAYVYLSRNFDPWPPAPLPDLAVPTLSLLLLLVVGAFAIPIHRRAEHGDRRGLCALLLLASAAQLGVLVLRALEFDALNVRWDTNAYGSAAWFILGMHTTLVVADFFETLAFGLIFLIGPVEKKHFEDADEVAFYSWFLVGSWIPLYFLLYFSPRWF